jgi:hypothetical protein
VMKCKMCAELLARLGNRPTIDQSVTSVNRREIAPYWVGVPASGNMRYGRH